MRVFHISFPQYSYFHFSHTIITGYNLTPSFIFTPPVLKLHSPCSVLSPICISQTSLEEKFRKLMPMLMICSYLPRVQRYAPPNSFPLPSSGTSIFLLFCGISPKLRAAFLPAPGPRPQLCGLVSRPAINDLPDVGTMCAF